MTFIDTIEANDVEGMRALLSQGLCPTAAEAGKTPLHWATAKGSAAIIELVGGAARERGALEARHRGRTALWASVWSGRRLAFDVLLALGADPNCSDEASGVLCAEGTALKVACDRGYLWAVKALLEAGARPNLVQPEETRAPLEAACRFGEDRWRSDEDRVEIVDHLLAAGADPNYVDPRFGRTALHELAVREGFGDAEAKVTAALVQAGARFDIADQGGAAPMMLAIDERCETAALAFLAAGAPPTPPAYRGPSALLAALRRRLGKLVVALADAGAPVPDNKVQAVQEYRSQQTQSVLHHTPTRDRPRAAAVLLQRLDALDLPATQPLPEVIEAIDAATSEGSWTDGQEWAELLLRAIAASPRYADVAEEVYGSRLELADDEEGPLADAWQDEAYSLLDPVFRALRAATPARPPRWGEVLLAACQALRTCGVSDLELVAETLDLGTGLAEHEPAEAALRGH